MQHLGIFILLWLLLDLHLGLFIYPLLLLKLIFGSENIGKIVIELNIYHYLPAFGLDVFSYFLQFLLLNCLVIFYP